MKILARSLLTLMAATLSLTATMAARQAAAPVDAVAAQAAFEHYEQMRTALSTDSLKGVASSATALAPFAAQLGGAAAEGAAKKVAGAKTLKAAREDFGLLSELLVPKFLAARLPGVEGFMCPMTNKQWAQKGEKTQNPYFGKSMPTCGTAIAK
jgi:hypothetical protein